MGLSLSPDIRRRFALLIDDGLSARAAARRLLISPASGIRLASTLRQGESPDPARQGRPAGRGKLSARQGFLTELVEQDPDITLAELRDALIMAEDVKVHSGSIARMLARLGYTYKKSRWLRPSAARPAFAISEPNGSRNACR